MTNHFLYVILSVSIKRSCAFFVKLKKRICIVMKKHQKLIPVIAVALVILLTFSVFSAVTLIAKMLIKKDEPTTELPSEIVSETLVPVPDNSPTLAPESSEAPASDSTTAASAALKPSVTQRVNTTAAAPSPSATKAPAVTAAPDNTEETAADLSNLSVKEIQDMLFNTTDPNVAGQILTIAGFEYDAEQGIYYSQLDPLQRLFGFNMIYDAAAPRVGMVYSTKRIYFDYADKNWMVQIWKGQYGITAGAEIGLYNKPTDRLIPQYDCATDDELITMAFDFYNAGQYEFSRGPEKHWWLTGFKILQLGVGPLIDLDITLEFPNRKMANAFEEGLKTVSVTSLVDKLTYKRTKNTFYIEW